MALAVVLGVLGVGIVIGIVTWEIAAWCWRRTNRWLDGAIEEIAKASAEAEARGDQPW